MEIDQCSAIDRRGVYHSAVTMLLIYADMCPSWVIQYLRLPTVAPLLDIYRAILHPCRALLAAFIIFHFIRCPCSSSFHKCLFFFLFSVDSRYMLHLSFPFYAF